jgi:hypothetical protein
MPDGCRLLAETPPVWMTELEMEGEKHPYPAQRNQAGAVGANALLVRSRLIESRHYFECPGSSPITDCPPSSGAGFRVVFESYACTPNALHALSHKIQTRHTGGSL